MSTDVTIFVPGSPAPQGSKRHVGKGIMVESSKYVAPWRTDVKHVVYQYFWERDIAPLDGAVYVALSFIMPRPKSVPKRSTPLAIKRPDIDKLSRAVLDAVKGVAWHDDSQVVELCAYKRIADIGETGGLHLRLSSKSLIYNVNTLGPFYTGELDYVHLSPGYRM